MDTKTTTAPASLEDLEGSAIAALRALAGDTTSESVRLEAARLLLDHVTRERARARHADLIAARVVTPAP